MGKFTETVLIGLVILVFSSSWIFLLQEAKAQARDIEICETRYEIWKQVGTEQYYRMFDKNDYSRFCVSMYEGSGLPQEVKGGYENVDLGLKINFPQDWSGTSFDFEGIIQVLMLPDDENRVYSNDEMPLIMSLSIMDNSAVTNMADRIFESASGNLTETYLTRSNCDSSPGSIVLVNDVSSYQLSIECYDALTSLTANVISSSFMTDEKIISLLAVWLHEPSKQIDTTEFDTTLQSLQIEKTVEFTKFVDSEELGKVTRPQIPDWIKNNAKWWAEGQIGDLDFTNGIQHLMKEKIINIPDLPEQASEVAKEKVPDWVKNNAGWWAEGLISEEDFLNGIKYLVEKGIIRV